MLRRISVLLMSVLLVLALVDSVALAKTEPDLSGRGVQRAEEEHIAGNPNDANAWGAVTSQTASNTNSPFTFGQHASDPIPGDEDRETPRLGLGNVSRNDSGQAEVFDTDPKGTHPSNHACVVGDAFGADCEGEPGPLPA